MISKSIGLVLVTVVMQLTVFAQPKFSNLVLPVIGLRPVSDIVIAPGATAKTTAVLPPIVYLPLSCYVVGTTCSIVPVNLLDFSATRLNDQTAGLVWHTANEADLTGYYVQRSPDAAITFTDRGFVPFANTGSTEHEYRFNDPNDLTVVSYYRLRITHADGSFSYSDVRPVKPVKESSLMIAYPSPAHSLVNIRITSPKAGKARMVWNDAAGRTVSEKNITLIAGTTVFTENVSTLAGGTYFISLQQEGSTTLKAVFYKL